MTTRQPLEIALAEQRTPTGRWRRPSSSPPTGAGAATRTPGGSSCASCGSAGGVELADRSRVFNDTRELAPSAPGPDGAGTTLTWPVEFEPRPGLSYALDALQSPEAPSLAMTANPAVLPRPAMERFLYGIEELILTEAGRAAH